MIPDFLQRHRAGVTMVFLVSVALLCLTLRLTPLVNGTKSAVWFLISPDVVYSGQFFNKLDSLRGRLFELMRVQGENAILRDQNAHLSKREVERDLLEAENNRLRTLLNLKQKLFPEGTPAEVISADARDWFHSISLNKGAAQGINVAAAVVTGAPERPMLVGRVVEVKDSVSKVVLLTDALSAIAVTVPRTNDMGLLEGQGKTLVPFRYLQQRSEISVGDEVVTAGMGGIFPAGVPVGQVVQVKDSADGFFKEAIVAPYANLGALREVMVLERRELP